VTAHLIYFINSRALILVQCISCLKALQSKTAYLIDILVSTSVNWALWT